MLSYQHGYHAGNFADVVKHLTLTRLLTYLTQKDKPLFYLETHSGRGQYNLQDPAALKTKEAETGIHLLWRQHRTMASLFTHYFAEIQRLNPTGDLHIYPGSPALALALLRPQDRLYFNELHPQEFQALTTLPKRGQRTFYHQADGLSQLTALLPPMERRALIFIDPTYEVKQEYRQVYQAINSAVERFSTGVYCLWYPIIPGPWHEQLTHNLSQIDRFHLQAEFYLHKELTPGMPGCGMWTINPPFTLHDELHEIFTTLTEIFNPGESFHHIRTY